jgi:type IV pilus assembly protein PilO
MAMSDLGERFAKLPVRQKYLGLIVALGLLGGAFYMLFYSELSDEIAKLDRQRANLEIEKNKYEEQKQKYMAFRAEVKKLLRKKKALLKELPTTAEIPSFLQSLHAQAELAGLNIKTFRKQKEVRRGFYGEIPVRMAIEGTYHQITRFFYSVGNLKRIVTVRDVLLGTSRKKAGTASKAGIVLDAKFVASTFRFIEKKAPPRRRKRGKRG